MPKEGALNLAARRGDAAMARVLLERGARSYGG